MEEKNCGGLRYLLRFPEGFDEKGKHPLLLFLHGAGSRGSEMKKLEENPFFRIIEGHRDFPFVVAAPLCEENTWIDAWERLTALVKELCALPYADGERVYAMGASMGGYATWQIAMSLPRCFAAIVPICGGGMAWNAGRLCEVPVWAFHGAKDPAVAPEESLRMVEAVNRRGGNARLTVYPENAHDAWSDTYADPAVFSWLLEHRRSGSGETADGYADPKQYG